LPGALGRGCSLSGAGLGSSGQIVADLRLANPPNRPTEITVPAFP
jgi:hypothetical protein